MKAGRNDPCPCGSGKKYKKCCLAAGQEAPPKSTELISSAFSTAASPRFTQPFPNTTESTTPARNAEISTPSQPRDPIIDRGDKLWEEFASQTGEGRIAVFFKALEEPEVMTPDMAFEMLDKLYVETVKSGSRARFEECINALRERLPEVYDESRQFYLSWCLENALAENRRKLVPSLARELAATAGRNIDTFNRACERLAFHGELPVLVEAMRIGWPLVKNGGNVVPWGIAEFVEKGVRYEILDHLEHTSNPDPNDPLLLDRIEFFIKKPIEEYVGERISDLTGKSRRDWQVNDFALKPPRKRRDRDGWNDDDGHGEPETPDSGAANLSRLIAEFVGYLRREEGVSFARGDLVSQELFRYFMKRHAGSLDPHPSMMESILHPERKQSKPPRPAHLLCPERVTLDVHLGGMMGMLSGQYHSAGALFQAMPAWLRFLESRGLIDAATRRKVTADLLQLHPTLLKIWNDQDDPLLVRQGKAWLELP